MFLKDLGMLAAFEQVSQAGVKRTLVPTVQFVLLYFLKVLLGGESMNELACLLFSDLALMELVGFNAYHCENGLTRRGDASRKTKKKQGPITAQCLADDICKLTQDEMERLFNQMVHLLARRGWFSENLLVALDGSKLPTPESYEGCGRVKQTRKVKVKGQKEPVTQEYYVSGWKAWCLSRFTRACRWLSNSCQSRSMRESGSSRSWSRRSSIWVSMHAWRPSWWIAGIWMERTCGACINEA